LKRSLENANAENAPTTIDRMAFSAAKYDEFQIQVINGIVGEVNSVS
jgi:hypothetical protein